VHPSKQASIKHLWSIQASKQAQDPISSKQADGPQAWRLLACGHHWSLVSFYFIFSFNHTAFKLNSLWHVRYLLDDFYAYTCALASIFDCTILLAVPTIQSRHGFWAQCPPTFITLWYRITRLTPLHHPIRLFSCGRKVSSLQELSAS
jgi:hypothetical protein